LDLTVVAGCFGIFFGEKENLPLLMRNGKIEKAIVRENRQQDKDKRSRTVE
jgi:hypothetical protein